MSNYVPSVEQLVVEIFVRNANRSKTFYQQLGFHIAEDRGTFVVLTWEEHELFLDERPNLPCQRARPHRQTFVSWWRMSMRTGSARPP